MRAYLDLADEEASMGSARRILLVEDHGASREALAELLRADGYQVLALTCGLDAVSQMPQWNPDLAIIDLQLPDLDGVEVMRSIRRARPEIMVILISGSRDLHIDEKGGSYFSDRSNEAYHEGAAAYLEKPLNLDHLGDVLRSCLAS